MKKTLIALMVAATCAMGGETLSLSSKLSYTDPTDSSKDFVISAYDTFVGQTRNYIDDFEINGVDCIDADRQGAIPTTSGRTIKLNLGAMVADGDTTSLSNGICLTQICFIGRDQATDNPEGITLSLTVAGVTYTSEAVIYGAFDKHNAITFNFANGPVLTSLENIEVTYSGNTNMGSGVFKAQNGAVLSGVNNGSLNWNAVAKVTFAATATPSVPEPATATLSLLALAGLAARRRRK